MNKPLDLRAASADNISKQRAEGDAMGTDKPEEVEGMAGKEQKNIFPERKLWLKLFLVLLGMVLILGLVISVYIWIDEPHVNDERIECYSQLGAIEYEAEEYKAVHGSYPHGLEDLIAEYGHEFTCPQGGIYTLDQSTVPPEAHCSLHGTRNNFIAVSEKKSWRKRLITPQSIPVLVFLALNVAYATFLWKKKPFSRGGREVDGQQT